MAKIAPDARTRTHTRRFHVMFCVKWTDEGGYPSQKRFDFFWESLGFWWKLRYLKIHNVKWEIER